MIEARRSPVDGMWRAWGEFSASQLGLLTPEEVREGTPDRLVWVCMAVAAHKWDVVNRRGRIVAEGAIHKALRIAQRMTPKNKRQAA